MAEQTKQALKVENNTNFPNNNTGYITPALLREFNTDMIDSTVNQIAYTADSASFDSRIDSVSAVATGSLLVTASAAGATMTFTKGDGSTFDVAIPAGDTTALNQYTASNDLRWDYLDTQSGSWAVTGSNVSFTSVTASFKGDGSGLTNVTASFTGVPISNDGIPQGTAGTLNFTGSAVNASVVGGIALITVDSIGTASFNSFTQSVDSRLDSLEAATSSYANSASVAAVDLAQQNQIDSLIAASSSFDNSALNAFTASIAGTNAFTQSAKLEFASIEAFTASVAGTNTFTASVAGTNAFTASIAGTNAFTQSTNASISTINNAITAINGFTASNSTYEINQWTGSINQFTQSAKLELAALEAATGSYATTGSNTFTGVNTFEDGIKVNQISAQNGGVDGPDITITPYIGGVVKLDNGVSVGGDQTITGSLVVTGTITANELHVIIESSSVIYSSGSNQLGDALSDTQILSGSTKLVGTATLNGNALVTSAETSSYIQNLGPLNAFSASTNLFTASVAGTNAFTQSINSRVSGLEAATSSYAISSSVAAVDLGQQNQIDAIIAWTGSVVATDITALNNFTASIAGTNAFTASATLRLNSLEATTASLNTSVANLNTFSASALITASANLNTITFSKGDGSTFNVTVNTGSAGSTTDISALNAFTASVFGTNAFTASIAGTNAFTQSIDGRVDALEAATSSYITSAQTSSMTVLSSSFAVSASHAETADVVGLFNNTITDGVLDQFLSTNGAGTLSFDWVKTLHQNIRNVDSVTISRGTPLFVSGSTGDNANVFVADANNPLRRPATLIAYDTTLAPAGTGTAIISGEIQNVNTTGYTSGTVVYLAAGGGWTSTRPTGSSSVQVLGVVTLEATNGRGIVFNQVADTLPNIQQGYTWVGNVDGVPTAVATSSFGTPIDLGPLNAFSASTNLFTASVAGTNAFTASTITSLNALGVFTASVAGTNAFTASALVTASFSGNTLTFTKGNGTTFGVVIPDVSGSTINTGSFATTGSNAFFGNQTISGSVGISGSAITFVSGTLSGSTITNIGDTFTDVAPVNRIITLTSASYAALVTGSATDPNALYIVSGSTSGSIAGAGLTSNTFSGSQVFTGSVRGNVIAASITSNTASLDFSQGNFFTLALAATVGTHISASNVQPGETVSIRITQNATPGTLTYSSAMKFPSGSAYTASSTANAVDIVTFISYDNSTVYASSVKNMI